MLGRRWFSALHFERFRNFISAIVAQSPVEPGGSAAISAPSATFSGFLKSYGEASPHGIRLIRDNLRAADHIFSWSRGQILDKDPAPLLYNKSAFGSSFRFVMI